MEDNEQLKVVPSEDGIQDEELESSTSETQDEEATSQEATETEPPFHEHPRWKELQEERRELKEQNALMQQKLLEVINNQRPTQQQIEEKIYEANTPEEREFWQKVERIADTKAEKRLKALEEQFIAEKRVLYNQYANLAANEFLKSHPDVKRGSEELKEIVTAARNKNLELEDAYRLVMFDRKQETAVEQYRKKQQQKTKEKLAANVEQKTVSKQAPVISQTGEFDDAFQKTLDDAGVQW